MRECLIDGDVSGNTLDEFIRTRKKSMHQMYGTSEEEYESKTVPELNKIIEIRNGEVNLWFEDDLFCQVNFWCCCQLLVDKNITAYLIRPEDSLQYGFAGLSQEELQKAFTDRIKLEDSDLKMFADLWRNYQQNDNETLLTISGKNSNMFPFLGPAVQAQINRQPIGHGLPEQTLAEIIDSSSHPDFGPVFQEFSKRLPIYGFGDLQVKCMFDRLIQK